MFRIKAESGLGNKIKAAVHNCIQLLSLLSSGRLWFRPSPLMEWRVPAIHPVCLRLSIEYSNQLKHVHGKAHLIPRRGWSPSLLARTSREGRRDSRGVATAAGVNAPSRTVSCWFASHTRHRLTTMCHTDGTGFSTRKKEVASLPGKPAKIATIADPSSLETLPSLVFQCTWQKSCP